MYYMEISANIKVWKIQLLKISNSAKFFLKLNLVPSKELLLEGLQAQVRQPMSIWSENNFRPKKGSVFRFHQPIFWAGLLVELKNMWGKHSDSYLNFNQQYLSFKISIYYLGRKKWHPMKPPLPHYFHKWTILINHLLSLVPITLTGSWVDQCISQGGSKNK